MDGARLDEVLDDYRAALTRADLSGHARRAYASRVSGFLDWLADTAGLDDDPSPSAPEPSTPHCWSTRDAPSSAPGDTALTAAPWCPRNEEYAVSVREAFLTGSSPSDFPAEHYERDWTGRFTVEQLNETGRSGMGFD